MKIVKTVLPLLLILLVLGEISLHVANVFLPFHWGNDAFSKKIQYLEQENEQPQAIFIGSSVTYRHVIPFLFDSLTNNTSYNLAVDAVMPPQSFYLLDQLIDQENQLDYIFFELSSFASLSDQHFLTTRSKYYINAKWLLTSYLYLFSSDITWRHKLGMYYKYTRSYLDNVFKVGMRKDLLAFIERTEHDLEDYSVNEGGFAAFPGNKTNNEKKLKELPKQIREMKAKYKRIYDNREKYNNVKYNTALKRILEEYIQKVNSRNIRLIYVLNPVEYSFDTIEQMTALFNTLPPENKIDLADPYKNEDLYDLQYRWDQQHFNYEGAVLYTRQLSQSFKDLTSN